MLLNAGFADSLAGLVTLLIIFAAVLALTYFCARWIAGYQKTMSEGNIVKIIETTQVAPGKFIQVVKIGNKYVAVSLCKESMTLLTELEGEQLEDFVDKSDNLRKNFFKKGSGDSPAFYESFRELFDKVIQKKDIESPNTDEKNDKENF